jgi:hypothetical protein
MFALLDAEHVELALVPADDDIDADAAFADVIRGDEFLRRDPPGKSPSNVRAALFMIAVRTL